MIWSFVGQSGAWVSVPGLILLGALASARGTGTAAARVTVSGHVYLVHTQFEPVAGPGERDGDGDGDGGDGDGDSHGCDEQLIVELTDGTSEVINDPAPEWIALAVSAGGLQLRDTPMLTYPPIGGDGHGSHARGGLWFPADAVVPVALAAAAGQTDTWRNGTRRALVLRVSGLETPNSYTMAELSNAWFGTDGDPVNARERFSACSHQALMFEPAADTATGIIGGVLDVVLPFTNVTETNRIDLADQARGVAAAQLGVELGSYPGSGPYDHHMVCLPPGVPRDASGGSWAAFAGTNRQFSCYNDLWCLSVSAQVHEIGHNLGLGHAGEGACRLAWPCSPATALLN